MGNNEAKKVYSKFGLNYTIIYWVYAAIALIILGISKLIPGGVSDTASYLIQFIIRFALIYPIMYLSIRNIPKFEISKKKLGVGGFIACYCITLFLMYVSNIIGMALNSFLGSLTGKGGVNPIFELVGTMSPIMQVIFVAILAPIWEELLFRKFLIDRVVNYGEVTAMLLSGIMFGLYHGNLAQCAYATTIGLFFAFIYIRTGRIGYTIALHMLINGFSTFVTAVLLKGINVAEMMSYLTNGDTEAYMAFVQENISALASVSLAGMFIIIAGIAGLILIIVLRKKFVFEHHDEEIPKGQRFATAVCNPGMILFFVYWIGTVILMQLGVSIFEQIKSLLGLA